MKRILYFVIAVLIAACSNQEKPKQESSDGSWDVTISGQVKYRGTGQVTITELSSEQGYNDTIAVAANGSFSKTIHVKEPGYYQFSFYDQQIVNVMVNKSNFTLNVDGVSNGETEIIGSPEHDVINTVQLQEMKFRNPPAIAQLQAEFTMAGRAKQDEKVAELKDRYLQLMTLNNDSTIAKLHNVPVNLGLINILQGQTFDRDRYYDFYKEVAAKAAQEYPNATHYKQFVDMVQRMAVTAIGVKAPEISLPDTNGKIVTLSSFQGKYVLVDFWAFWCGPCRAENPNVVKAYKKYKGKNFEILGVSLDKDKSSWEKAIKDDGLVWTQVSDLKYFQSQAALDYNIDAIPFSILVDPNGVIIAKNLRGNALERKLKEVLDKKS
ncbi:MAG TPA: TlpA disulfide reductase family protein [Cyclobacteriaceae bacterium]|nr:TlpA disulfide reductase family protein [Cyclobacteriaceae bacterium]